MNPGNKYIALVLGLLGFSVATCVVLIGYATHDPTFAVEKNYYQKAVAFDQIRAEEVASDRLGWKVLVAPAKVGAEGGFVFTVLDSNDQPVTGASGTLEAFANIRANAPDTEDVEDLGGGKYRARIPIRHAGAWELRLRLTRGSDVFRETKRVEAGSAS
jgi:nitrogen fixation protein FixH